MRNLMKFGMVLVVLTMVTSSAFASNDYEGPDPGSWCVPENWDNGTVPYYNDGEGVRIRGGEYVTIDSYCTNGAEELEIRDGTLQIGTSIANGDAADFRLPVFDIDKDLEMAEDRSDDFAVLNIVNGNVWVDDKSKDLGEDGDIHIIVAAGSSLTFDDAFYLGDSNDGKNSVYVFDIAGDVFVQGDKPEHRGGQWIVNLTGEGTFDLSDNPDKDEPGDREKTARLSSDDDSVVTINITDNATFSHDKIELGEKDDGAKFDYSMAVNISGNGTWNGGGEEIKDQDDGQIFNLDVTGNGSFELKDLNINNDGSEINITMDSGTIDISDDIDMEAGDIVITGGVFEVHDNFELGDKGVATMTVSGTAEVFIDDLYMDGDAELTINGIRVDLDSLKDCGSIEINGAGSLVDKDADDPDDWDDLNEYVDDGDITTSNPGMVIVTDYGITNSGRFTIQPAIPVQVDIKPGSSSNPLRVNFGGSGVYPVAILGTNDLDVTTIDVNSGTLEGADAVRKGKVGDVNQDGKLDLVLKFNRTDILDALEDVYGDLAELPNREKLTLTLFAKTTDGDLVSGTDTLVILNRGRINRSRR